MKEKTYNVSNFNPLNFLQIEKIFPNAKVVDNLEYGETKSEYGFSDFDIEYQKISSKPKIVPNLEHFIHQNSHSSHKSALSKTTAYSSYAKNSKENHDTQNQSLDLPPSQSVVNDFYYQRDKINKNLNAKIRNQRIQNYIQEYRQKNMEFSL